MRLLLGSLLGILVPTLVSPLAEPLLSRAGTVKLPFTSKEEQLRLLREWIDQVDPELAHYPPQYFVNPASIVVSDRVADDLRRLDDGTFDESRQHLGRSLLDANETCEIDLSLSKTAGLANDEEITLTITNNCTDGPNAPSTSHWIGLYPNAAANISETVPVKFAFPSHVDDSYLVTGTAKLTLRMTNMRADYLIYFFTSNWEGYSYQTIDFGVGKYSGYLSYPDQIQALQSAVAQAVSPKISFAVPNEPLKPRVVPFVPMKGSTFAGISPDFTGRMMQFLWSAKELQQSAGGNATYLLDAVFYDDVLPECADATSDLSGCSICEEEFVDQCGNGTLIRIPYDDEMGSADYFTPEDLCDVPATTYGWHDPGLIARALLPQISSGHRHVLYMLRNVDEEGEHVSPKLKFAFPPAEEISANNGLVSVACYGDMGRGTYDDTFTWQEYGTPSINTTKRLAANAENGDIKAVFHIGDISYARGYGAVWDEWLDMASAYAHQVPYFVLQGNHEYDGDLSRVVWPPTFTDEITIFPKNDSGGECGVATSAYLRSPSDTSEYGTYYSYEIGGLHIIGMNTEMNFSMGSPQYEWIRQDLMAVDRAKTPFILFGGHRPGYIDSNYETSPSGDGDLQVSDLLVQYIEPLLVQYNVTLAIWGHNHAVQRMCSCYRGACVQQSTHGDPDIYENPPYPVHMVIGTAGAGFTKNAGGFGSNPNPPAAYVQHVFYEWGYAIVSVYNDSTLGFDFINSLTDEVTDSFFINQNPEDFLELDNAFVPNPPGLILASLAPEQFPPPPPPPKSHHEGSSHSSLSAGAIVGITFSIVLVLGLAGFAAVKFARRRRALYTRGPYLDIDMDDKNYATFA